MAIKTASHNANTRIVMAENSVSGLKGKERANVIESVTDRQFVENVWQSHKFVDVLPEGMPKQAGLYEVNLDPDSITAVDQDAFNALFFMSRMIVTESAVRLAANSMPVTFKVGSLGGTSINGNLFALILSAGGIPNYAAVRKPYERADIPPITKGEYIVLTSPTGEETIIKPSRGTSVRILTESKLRR